MIGAGATSGGAMDASNLLKPALAVRCDALHRFDHVQGISPAFREGPGACSPVPEDRRQGADHRLMRSRSSKACKPYFEEFHKIKYTDEAIKAAVELSAKLHSRPQVAGQGDRCRRRDRSFANAPARRQAQEEDQLLPRSRLPSRQWRASRPKTVSKSDAEKVLVGNLETDLKRLVFGQDNAIEAASLTAAIKLARAGLREPEKPIGCYLVLRPDRCRQN